MHLRVCSSDLDHPDGLSTSAWSIREIALIPHLALIAGASSVFFSTLLRPELLFPAVGWAEWASGSSFSIALALIAAELDGTEIIIWLSSREPYSRYTGQSRSGHFKCCYINGNTGMLPPRPAFVISSILQILTKCLLHPCDGLWEGMYIEVVEMGPFPFGHQDWGHVSCVWEMSPVVCSTLLSGSTVCSLF